MKHRKQSIVGDDDQLSPARFQAGYLQNPTAAIPAPRRHRKRERKKKESPIEQLGGAKISSSVRRKTIPQVCAIQEKKEAAGGFAWCSFM